MFIGEQLTTMLALLCLLLLHNLLSVRADQVSLIDPDPVEANKAEPDFLPRFAGYLCDEQKSRKGDWQISRISTIHKLGDHLESLPFDHKLASCRDAVIKPMRELRLLINSSNGNVCSDNKVSLIERFHKDYVSINKDDLAERDPSVRLPSLLKLFFMHYAMEVSAICKRNLINTLEWDLKHRLDSRDLEMFKDNVMDNLLSTFSKSLVSVENVKDFDDAILIWDLIDSFRVDVSNWGPEGPPAEIGDYPDGYKMYMKVAKASGFWRVQHMCRNRFKPIYDKLITPIIRLSNLGYSYRGETLSREMGELRQNAEVKKWYSITQFCESILPIGIFEDPRLGVTAGVMIMADEANLLRPLQPARDPSLDQIELMEFEPSTNSMQGVDQLDGLQSSERQELLKKVDLEQSKRSRIMLSSVNRIVRNLSNLMSIFKMVQLFVTDRKEEFKNLNPDGTAKTPESSYVEVSSVLKGSDKLTDKELLELEGGLARKGIERVKRRPRKNDIDLEGWKEAIDKLLPSRRVLIVVGFIVLGVGVLAAICACITAGISGLTLAG